jgi:hypothetical protein
VSKRAGCRLQVACGRFSRKIGSVNDEHKYVPT